MDMQAAALTARMGATASCGRYGGGRSSLGLEVESPSQTEVRLNAALRAAEIQILEQPYAWATIGQDNFPEGLNKDAVALVQDGHGWSQLIPASRKESWTLICMRFRAGVNVEGFLEWFAFYLRRRVTPRFMIVGALGELTSGPHFCWAVPWSVREQAVREIEILSTPPRTGVRGVGLM